MAPNGVAADCDFSIIALTKRRFDAASAAIRTADNNAAALRCVEIAVQQKRSRYAGRTTHTFVPLIITTGGTTNEAFRNWLRVMVKRIPEVRVRVSCILLRYRAMLTPTS